MRVSMNKFKDIYQKESQNKYKENKKVIHPLLIEVGEYY